MDKKEYNLRKTVERLEELAKHNCFEGYDGDLICESEWGYYTIKREQITPED